MYNFRLERAKYYEIFQNNRLLIETEDICRHLDWLSRQ